MPRRLHFVITLLLAFSFSAFSQFQKVGIESQVNTISAENQWNPSVAADTSGNYVVVWEGWNASTGYEVYAQSFDNTGTAISAEILVNNATAGNQRMPDVAMDADGNFMVVWMDDTQDQNGWGVYGRHFNLAGTALTSDGRINSATGGHQRDPKIASNLAGETIVVWADVSLAGTSHRIKGASLQTGLISDTYFTATLTDTTVVAHPDIDMLEDGSFTVVWQALGLDSEGTSIQLRRYDDAGNGGAEVQVNTVTAGNQQEPAISIDASGNEFIVWSSFGQDGDAYGIFSQRYDANGNALGVERQINSTSAGSQDHASVSVSFHGYAVVSWSSYGQDGDYSGTYAQIFDENGDSMDVETRVNSTTQQFQQLPAVDMYYFKKGWHIAWQDGFLNSNATADGNDYGIFTQAYESTLPDDCLPDKTDPVLSCSDIVITTDPTVCSATVSYSLTATDNCGGEITLTQLSGTTIGQSQAVGVVAASWEATDNSGNKGTCSFNVDVQDNTKPNMVCADHSVYLNTSGVATITVQDVDGGTTDGCSLASLTVSETSFGCVEVGANPVSLVAIDASGNSDTCVAIVTILDSVPPVAICKNVALQLDGNGSVNLSAAEVDDGSSDQCGSVNLSINFGSFDCTDVGNKTVLLSVADNANNITTCTSDVSISDAAAPTAVCQNLTLSLDQSGAASIVPAQIDNGSTDNCAGLSLSLSQSLFSCSDAGSTVISLRAIDASLNTSSCSATVTVQDDGNPVISCPADTVVDCSIYNYQVSFSDNCGGAALSQLSGLPSGSFYENGVTTNLWQVSDSSGNLDSCAWNVTNSFATSDSIEPKLSQILGGFAGTLEKKGGFGSSVAYIPDLDGNGADDLVVGAFKSTHTNSLGKPEKFAGSVWVLFLNTDKTVIGQQQIGGGIGGIHQDSLLKKDFFGWSVASLGDISGDGLPDIVVGAPGRTLISTAGKKLASAGSIFTIFLNSDGTAQDYQRFDLTTGGFTQAGGIGGKKYNFGASVASSDINADQINDIIVGSVGSDNTIPPDKTGKLVFSGDVTVLFMDNSGDLSISGLQRIADQDLPGNPLDKKEAFGSSVSVFGNRLIVGAPGLRLKNSGRVFTFDVDATGAVIDTAEIIDETQMSSQLSKKDGFGASVCFIGDIDGDGTEDAAIGAPGDDHIKASEGAVYVVTLNANGSLKSEDAKIETPSGFVLEKKDAFGSSLSANLSSCIPALASGALFDDDGGKDFGAVYQFEPFEVQARTNKFDLRQNSLIADADGGTGFEWLMPNNEKKSADLFGFQPNPFNAHVVLRYRLLKSAEVKIEIHNLFGQKIRSLTDQSEQFEAGEGNRTFDLSDLSAGTYIFSISTPDSDYAVKLVKLRD